MTTDPQRTDRPAFEYEAELQDSIAVIKSEHRAAINLLQRRLRIGYRVACIVMDELERRGIVGPAKGVEPRDIKIPLTD